MSNNFHTIEYVELTAIKLRDRRWRNNPSRQIDEAVRQLERAGRIVEPPLLDNENHVVCGGAIVQAAKKLNWRQIPVLRVGNMTQDELRLYAINAHSLHAFFMSYHYLLELLRAGTVVFDRPKAMCTWVKSQPGQGSLFRSQTEQIVYFRTGKVSHRNNVQLGKHGRNRTTAWPFYLELLATPVPRYPALKRQVIALQAKWQADHVIV